VEKWKRERAKNVQPAMVNRELTVLKHMLKMAVKWGLSQNPAAGVAPFSGAGTARFGRESGTNQERFSGEKRSRAIGNRPENDGPARR
jgi:hypothetical protein